MRPSRASVRQTLAPRALRVVAGASALVALALLPRAAQAQDSTVTTPVVVVRDTLTILQRFNLDKLRLTALGVSLGRVKPTQVRATQSFSVHADYGHIAEHWHVMFSVTYWGSRYSAKTMQIFEDSLRKVIRDSTNDYQLAIGRIDITDIALGSELRWAPPGFARGRLRPYLGGGLAAHVVNAEGRAISGTFVERALDNITAGVLATAGTNVIVLQKFSVGLQARYDLLSGARFGSLRLLGTYIFEPDTPAAAVQRGRR